MYELELERVFARCWSYLGHETESRLPGMWEPNQDFVARQKPVLPHHIRTNSLGLRGPETTLSARGRRVLCLGDSFTFGDFVDDGETLPAQLDARLADVAEVLS